MKDQRPQGEVEDSNRRCKRAGVKLQLLHRIIEEKSGKGRFMLKAMKSLLLSSPVFKKSSACWMILHIKLLSSSEWAKQRFDTTIWLSISQSYTISKLQFDIASYIDLKDGVNYVSEQSAGELIHDRLGRKMALIVFDDMLMIAPEIMLTEKLGIQLGDSQIKVIVTTRSTDLCQRMNGFICKMELLSDQDSWDLFCTYAFPRSRSPQNLETVAPAVETECGRLPLAIKTIQNGG